MTRGAAWVVALAVLAGCGDDPTATVIVELAPMPGSDACNVSSGFEPAEFPAEVETFHFLMCPAGPVPCIERDPASWISVQPLEGPTPAPDGGSPSVPGIFVDRNVAFDAALGGVPLRVEVIACADDDALARGVADGVRLGEDDLSVRLYRYDAVSCAGPRVEGADAALPLPRGFHALTRLGNGDILVYGGVTGTEVSTPESGAAGVLRWPGLPLEERVEVYRPSDERFFPVSGDTFRRVLFTSTLVDGPSNGPQRIRVYGGLTAPVGTAVLRFDHTQGRSALSAPMLPHPSAEVAGAVDLVYDPASRSLRVEEVRAGTVAIPKAAASALAAPGEGPGALALGLASTGEMPPKIEFAAAGAPILSSAQLNWNTPMRGEPNLPLPDASYVTLGADGAAIAGGDLLSGRFGHTATTVDGVSPGATLVWGGNVYDADPSNRDARTGEIILAGSGTSPIEAGGVTGLPASTAFHTATALSGSDVLLAGGAVVGCVTMAACPAPPLTTLRPDPALAVLHWEGRFVQAPVIGSAEPTLFHAATAVHAEPGTPGAEALGAFITGGAGALLAPSSQVVQVSRGGTGYVATQPFADARLGEARFGHAAVQVSERRLLVTGGLVVGGGNVRAIGSAEVVAWDPAAFWNPCPARPEAGGVPFFPEDAGAVRPDAGPDAGPDASAPSDGAIGADSGTDSGL